MSTKETAAISQLLALLEARYAMRVLWALQDGHAQGGPAALRRIGILVVDAGARFPGNNAPEQARAIDDADIRALVRDQPFTGGPGGDCHFWKQDCKEEKRNNRPHGHSLEHGTARGKAPADS